MEASPGKCGKMLLQVFRTEQLILVPDHNCRMQNAGLVKSRHDPGKDTRAFRKESISPTSGNRAGRDKYLGGKGRGNHCKVLQAALACRMSQAGCWEHSPLAAQEWRSRDVLIPQAQVSQGFSVRGQLRTLAQQGRQQEEFPMGWKKR